MITIRTRLKRAFCAFRTSETGNVAIIFAFAMLPIIGGVGAAVDYSHANSVKAAMQSALDSTALMLAKDAATTSSSDLQSKATTYFTALFTRPEAKSIFISAAYTTTSGSAVTVNGTANVPTNFLGVMGYSNIAISASATSKWGSSRLRVALVLDNTGSMADNGKITALKTATNNLLTQLKNAASVNGDVYVSIIPFSKDVNVGSSNSVSSWVDWSVWDTLNGVSTGSTMSGSICISGTLWQVNGSSFTNGGSCSAPASGICFNGTLWNWNGYSFTSGGACTAATVRSNWNGCVTDRGNTNGPNTANYDTNVVAPTTSILGSLFTAEQYSSCPQAVDRPPLSGPIRMLV